MDCTCLAQAAFNESLKKQEPEPEPEDPQTSYGQWWARYGTVSKQQILPHPSMDWDDDVYKKVHNGDVLYLFKVKVLYFVHTVFSLCSSFHYSFQ